MSTITKIFDTFIKGFFPAIGRYWLHFIIYTGILEIVLISRHGWAGYDASFIFSLVLGWVLALIGLGLFFSFEKVIGK